MVWINVVLKTDQWQAFFSMVMNLAGFKNAGKVLTSWGTISFSGSQNGFCSTESLTLTHTHSMEQGPSWEASWFNFAFWGGVARQTPPPHWVRQCYSPTWACGWSISPVFHYFCTRWSCEFISRISHFTPPGKIPQWSPDRTLVSHNAAVVWTWRWELSFPSGNSATANTVVSCGLVYNTVWGIGLRHSWRQAYFHKTSESREGTLTTWAV